ASVTLQALASFNSALSFNRVGQSALADLRRECYSRLISLPMAFFGQRRIGELTSRVSTDVAQIEGALIDALPQMCRQSVFLLGGIVIVLWFGAGLLRRGEISPGELTRFVLYTTFVAGAMGQAAELFSQIQKTVGATQRVRELLREPAEIDAAAAAGDSSPTK